MSTTTKYDQGDGYLRASCIAQLLAVSVCKATYDPWMAIYNMSQGINRKACLRLNKAVMRLISTPTTIPRTNVAMAESMQQNPWLANYIVAEIRTLPVPAVVDLFEVAPRHQCGAVSVF
jgi:hypothetical protein